MVVAAYLFLSTFVLVFALVFQSRCVNSGQRGIASLNSFVISGSQLILLKLGPDATGIEYAGYMLGGPCAVYASMAAHDHIFDLGGGGAMNIWQRLKLRILIERAEHLNNRLATMGLELQELSKEQGEAEESRREIESQILALKGG